VALTRLVWSTLPTTILRDPIFTNSGKLAFLEEQPVKFAKIVFWIAAISGLLTITPLYFIFDLIGEKDPPPITHPAFFYGFVGVALVWQIAFVFIARDPVRFRPIMIPGILEKLVYAIPVIILVLQKRTRPADLTFAAIDLSLGILFVIAYLRTPATASS